MAQVAIITGGASGIGLAVVKALINHPSQKWHVHILDLNVESGKAVAASMQNTTFHQCDVTDYAVQSKIFHSIFESHKRLDFVFANAGIMDASDFFARHDDCIDRPPPPVDYRTIDIDLKAVIDTTYLAIHYFRRNAKDEVRNANVVTTSSINGLYTNWWAPLYSPAKYGVLGFVRAIGAKIHKEGIRVNSICPNAVVTNIIPAEAWKIVPLERRTSLESIVKVVLMLNDGNTATDSESVTVEGRKMFGRVVEVSRDKFYFRDEAQSSDEDTKWIIAMSNGAEEELRTQY